MTEIDWIDVGIALTDQFWVPVLASSSSEAWPAKNLNFAAVKNFSWTYQPRPISKGKLVLDIYFRPFSSILEVMFFLKMAICKYLILVIFGQFWLLRADFAPKMWKVYLFQLFRCKNINRTKKWVHVVISKYGSQNPPLAHRKHRNTKKWPQEGQNWQQCTSCGPTNWFWAKKTKF